MTEWREAAQRAAEMAKADEDEQQRQQELAAEGALSARANNLLAEADQVVTEFLTAMNSADNPGGSNFKRFREPMIRRFLRNGLPLAR